MGKRQQPQLNPATPTDDEFSLKATFPKIGNISAGSFNLVEPMNYLYIRIVKAKNLYGGEDHPEYDPYIQVRIGNYRASTKHIEKNPNPEWNHVFAFSKDRVHSSMLEVFVMSKGDERDDIKGRVWLDATEVPIRVAPDSPLAPQWYNLESLNNGMCVNGELMLAVWVGTQADEAFTEAWHSDAAGVSGECIVNTRSKVYMSPKLWYLRLNVIQVRDLETKDKNRTTPEVFVRVIFRDLMRMTKISVSRNHNPVWNEDLMFVVAEPFESPLVLTLEDKVGNKEEVIGKCLIHVGSLERRLVDKPVDPRWYSLEGPTKQPVEGQNGENNINLLTSKIQLRASLDGGYHVLDETTQYSSDLRPTVRQLWKQGLGVLQLGILNATGLSLMKKNAQGRTDAYCVAKYGQKWVRTRTIIDSTSPQWNEQYTWEVYDPCTVITIGVFDNCHLQGTDDGKTQDSRIGKVRIRVSTLEAGRTYTYSYPLLSLQTNGLNKMGELQLAIRFSCTSMFNLLQIYSNPILPQMHYTHPLSSHQQVSLRHQATQLLASRLGRSEPPVRKEVVEYLLDYDSNLWCMRRTLANCHRIKLVFSSLENIIKWVGIICNWKMPWLTALVHVILVILVLFPQVLLPGICMNFFVCGIWNYKTRPRNPPHMDPKLSCISQTLQRDLEEEFDRVPTTCNNQEDLKFRYNRLRLGAGHVQTMLGDLAAQLERMQSLLNWRDPRATGLFVSFSLVAGFVLYLIPLRIMFILLVFYMLRHPKLKSKLPSSPSNFFRRLPTRVDSLL
ncbi:FT-interacting protein 3-like [Silene latifolia]|uniref:FT-interacting protein 3-like n=1 Tax=Silene latifolia TaxID=37657 RepID=UPI003D775561